MNLGNVFFPCSLVYLLYFVYLFLLPNQNALEFHVALLYTGING